MGLLTLKRISMIAVVALFTVSCSKKSSSSGDGSDKTGTTTTTGSDSTTYNSGAYADLSVVSHATLEDYAGRRISTPSNIKIHLDVFNVSSTSTPQFGGTLRISYVENGKTITGTFNSGTSIHDTQYNKWQTTNGTQKLKLMFQDNLGAMVVIIDPLNDLDVWKGEIYYRNFDFGVCSNPPFYGAPVCNVQSGLKCWNITAGPYDCRSFLSGNSMRPDIVDLPGYGSTYKHQGVTYPRKGFQKLGTFTNLNLENALNQ